MSCHYEKAGKTTSLGSVFKEGVESKSSQIEQGVLEGAIGLISTSENYQFGDTIFVFDKEGKVQNHIVFDDEYEVLSLKCLSKDNSFYKVKSENNEIGFIPKGEKGVIFQTWEEHVLSVFSIGFNEVSNPLLDSPLENSKKVYYDKDEFYHPSQIKGDWLQVKWGSEEDWKYGWIMWKDSEKLLIELYYFA
ncbi:hypothetical protein GCM10007049_30830 [Echinicola pacifica]|uniref:WG containing repeat-containing protein n=2 Tax=Echinicola pacifica TaxID=346377 RepID=A0A918Q888_9BACT|nr:hypothetical protein GCM10007049_30830 [Echinicola pacifica]